MELTSAIVTGGAGFIGSHLVDALVQKGTQVVVIDDLSSGHRENLPSQAELHELDIRDLKAAELIKAVRPDAVFHLAAQKNIRYSLEHPAEDASINIVGSIALLEAARQAQVKAFVFASTGGAIYDESSARPTNERALARPLSPYGMAKRSFELYLDAYSQVYGIKTLALRFANVYGPRQDPKGEAGVVAIFLKAILDGQAPSIYGNGDKTRDYVYVDDVVSAFLNAVGRSATGTYNIGTGIETSVNELWDMIAVAAKTDIVPDHGADVPGELQNSCLDWSAARKDFDWHPAIALQDGIGRTEQWFRSKK